MHGKLLLLVLYTFRAVVDVLGAVLHIFFEIPDSLLLGGLTIAETWVGEMVWVFDRENYSWKRIGVDAWNIIYWNRYKTLVFISKIGSIRVILFPEYFQSWYTTFHRPDLSIVMEFTIVICHYKVLQSKLLNQFQLIF